MQQAARRGILIKSGSVLERLAAVDAVVFDKTGTLTRGHPQVTEVVAVNSMSPDEVLQFAAACEQRMNHPAALCIVQHAEQMGIAIPERTRSSYKSGMGVSARVNGKTVLVGSRRLMEAEGIDMGPIEAEQVKVRARGESLG